MLASLLREKKNGVGQLPGDTKQNRFIDQFAISVKDLTSEVNLHQGIYPEKTVRLNGKQPEAALLTGATGFLGAFILDQLFKQTKADIYCLVRSPDSAEGRKRISANLQQYLLENRASSDRIKIICGDLSSPLLGLSKRDHEMLAEKIDIIYHNGASVNWIYPFSRLKQVNVDSVSEILRLACRQNLKPVHYTSTIAVFPLLNNKPGRVFYEDDSLDHGDIMLGGYSQTKWVAENNLILARERGIPVSIYRPGIISGHSTSGAWTTSDVISRLIKSWIELGCAPILEGAINMTPVDYVSKGLVQLSLIHTEENSNYHLVSPCLTDWRTVYDIIRENDYQLKFFPYEQWRKKILEQAGSKTASAASTLAPLFSEYSGSDKYAPGEYQPDQFRSELDRIGLMISRQYLSNKIRYDDCNARNTLEKFAVSCPLVNAKVISYGLRYFINRGFLFHPEYYR